MEGDLEAWPLAEVLLWLHRTQRSAGIRVEGSGATGWIFTCRGEVIACETSHGKGTSALARLLAQHRGTFRVSCQLAKLGRPNIFAPTEKLLLELTIARDERARLVA